MNTLELSDNDFSRIRFLVFKTTGITLSDSKRALIISRLARRLKQLQLESFDQYIDCLQRDRNEVASMINRITTNLTRFYRESAQFELLRSKVLPDILAAKPHGSKKVLRIWSAGCSTGEEVYTILFEILEFFRGYIPVDVDLKIVGSDIDTNVLKKAKSGCYEESETKGLTPNALQGYFDKLSTGQYRIKEKFARYVVFSRINLVYDDFQFKQQFDIIFCRNVVIYFSNETKKTVYEKFHGVLNNPGYFFSGHSENLFRYAGMYKFIERSAYKKVV